MEKITKLLTLFVGLLFAMTTSASVAETNDDVTNYNLTIHGVKVTSDNASDVLGNGVFSYDATANILSINGSFTGENRKRIVESSIPGLTVDIKSYSVLEAENAPVFTFNESAGVTGSGLLIVNSPNETGFYVTRGASLTIYDSDIVIQALWGIAGPRDTQIEKLTINNSNVSIATSGYEPGAICDLKGGFDLVKSFIYSPEGAYFDTKDLKNPDGSLATNVTILKTIVEATIDGIRYYLYGETNEASVIWNDYTGTIDIPASVTYGDKTYTVTAVNPWGFVGCSAVSITLPEGMTTIGDGAFNGCYALTTVTLPSTLTSVGSLLFNGSAVESVYCYATTPPAIISEYESTLLIEASNTATLYVPAGSLSAYQNASGWSEFSNIVEMETVLPEGTDLIVNGTFEDSDLSPFSYHRGASSGYDNPITSSFIQTESGNNIMVITSMDGAANSWDTQFFVGLSRPVVEGETLTFTMRAKADRNVLITTQADRNAPGDYIHWEFVGSYNLTDQWQTFTKEVTVTSQMAGAQYIAFTLNEGLESVTYYFDDMHLIGAGGDEPGPIVYGDNMIVNGTFEGTNMDAFSKVEQDISWIPSPLTLDDVIEYVTDNHCLFTHFGQVETNNEWKNRLIVNLNGTLEPGDHFRFSMRAKASDDVMISGHGTNSDINISIWGLIGQMNLTDEWQTFEVEGVVSESAEGSVNQLQFYMAVNDADGMDFYFDDMFLAKETDVEPDTDYSLIDNTVYLEPVQGVAGGQTTLSVKMKNTEPIQGLAFTLALPDGVTVATDADGFPMATLSLDRTTANKTDYFGSNIDADGNLRVVCSSSNGYTFDGNDGEVARITVNLASTMTKGDYAILLKNVSLSNNLNESHSVEKLKSTLSVIDFIPGDVNGDLEVDVADFTLMANYLLGKTLTVFIMEAADVAGGTGGVPDGDIDVADLTGIANIILHQ